MSGHTTWDSTVEQVIETIRTMITDGAIRPGDRFPSERKLSEQTGTSRNTVREALHYYETLGILEKRVGSGSYLIGDPDALYRAINSRQLLERYNILEMIETRRILETGIVRLAAERATEEDKQQLQTILQESIANSDAVKTEEGLAVYIRWDYELHRQFAVITDNSFLLEMFEAMRDTFLDAGNYWKYRPEKVTDSNAFHRKIVAAISAGDPEEAEEQLKAHLDDMVLMLDQVETQLEYDQ
ncbi:MAG: FadR family transcriptional regulator [Clostridia bacterium]|nr:FadR family transcriptional regulator [Clostridia bacterium]